MDREQRQRKIKSLIRAQRIATQADLAARLERAGVLMTQSSLSRDLEDLGIVKQNGHYAVPRTTTANERGLLSLEAAGEALIVAKCEPGLASSVAVEIDRATIAEIIGTLAGEDTIFIAVRDAKAQRAATKKIWSLFSGV